MSDDNFQFEDTDNFSASKEGFGKKVIILEQFRRCCIEGSRAMQTTVDKQGIKNQKEVFINSVKILEAALLGDLLKQTDIVQKNEAIDKKIDEINSEYILLKTKIKKKIHINSKIDPFLSIESFEDKFESRLVSIYLEKLGVMSLLLHKLNFFEESNAVFNIDDED